MIDAKKLLEFEILAQESGLLGKGNDKQIFTVSGVRTINGQQPDDKGDITVATSSASTLEALDEGVSLSAATASIDFVGDGVTATASGNDITVTIPGAAAAVDSLTGTASQVLVNGTSGSAQTGALTLTTPQNIHTAATPTFSKLTLDVATGTAPLVISSTTKVSNLNVDLLDDQTGSYYLDSDNFTGTEWTDLTDAGATTLHKHDHGGMDGLTDDDHTQYVLATGTRAMDKLTVNGTTQGIIAEITGANAVDAGRFITDSTDNATIGAIYASNDTNFAHAGYIGKFEAKNATDTSPILSLVNAGTGNYITADSVASLSKAGQLALATAGSTGGVLLGGDANLYRSAANILATDDSLLVATSGSASAAAIRVNEADTGLYLVAADTLAATAGGYNFVRANATKSIGWFNNAPNSGYYNYALITNTTDTQTVYYGVDFNFNNGNQELSVTILDFIARNGASSAGVELSTAVVRAENSATNLALWTAYIADPRLAGNISGAYSPTLRGYSFKPTDYSGTWSSSSGTVTMEAFYVPAKPTGYTPASVTFNYYGYHSLEGLFVHNDNGGDYDARFEGDADANLLFVDASADTVQIGSAATADSAKFYVSGKISTSGELEVNGALNHDGTTVGFYGVTPVVQTATYTASNTTTDRSYDANSTTVDELADVLGTLIADLKLTGIIG